MSLLDIAYRDNKQILESGGFERDIALIPPNSNTPYIVKAFVSNHSNPIDPDTGFTIDGRKISITINFETLKNVGYPLYENENTEVNLKNSMVEFQDSNGIIQHFIIERSMPDYTLKHITCILANRNNKQNKPTNILRSKKNVTTNNSFRK